MSKYPKYNWCAVPDCKNTSVRTPGKLWIRVPNDIKRRKTWFELAGRNPAVLSEKSKLYFCEDHFNLEHDMENYTKYKIMGSVSRVRMNTTCIPSKFECRKQKSASNTLQAKKERISKTSADGPVGAENVEPLSSCTEGAFPAANMIEIKIEVEPDAYTEVPVERSQLDEGLKEPKKELTEEELLVPSCDIKCEYESEPEYDAQLSSLARRVKPEPAEREAE